MAGFTTYSKEELAAILRKLANPLHQSGELQLPSGTQESFGSSPVNRPGGQEFTNTPDKGEKKIIKDFSIKRSVSSDQSAESKKKSNALLKEKARALAARSKYYEATAILEEVDSSEEITELGIKLLMAECYLQLGRENKAERRMRQLQTELLKKPTLGADEALSLVESLVDSNSHTSALIMLPVVRKLFKEVSPSDDQIEGIFRCIKKASECTGHMIAAGGRARILAIDFGVDFMVESLGEIENLNADPKKKAFKQILASMLIAYDYWSLRENLKGVRVREKAIRAMIDAFGEASAKQRRIFGSTLYNIGVGYAILNKHAEAISAYQRAIDAIEVANDYDDENSREKDLKMYKQKLRESKNM